MCPRVIRGLLFSTGLLALANYSSAATIVVTQPAGLLSAPSGGYATDPFSYNTWYRVANSGASSGITTNFPDAGNGSEYLSTLDSGGFAQLNYYLGTTQSLSSLSALSYQWLDSAGSTTASWDLPVLAIYIDPDGTGKHNGALIYNPSGNGASVTPGVWETSDSFTGSFGWYQFGLGSSDPTSRTLSSWIGGAHTPGYAQMSGNSVIQGFDFQVGPGSSGLFVGAVDEFTVAFGSAPATTTNFELSPEPASLFLTAGALFAAVCLRRRAVR
jgi:hypothetical protein